MTKSQEPLVYSVRAPENADSAMPGVTELRVHGVGGSSPSEVLSVVDVRRVAGDAGAGFYRPRLPEGDLPAVQREAYSWGSLTSGAAARAFWLLLVPFTLANVASWARPWRSTAGAAAFPRVTERVLLAACRVLALSLTVTLVLTAAGVAMNLLAWQCLTSSIRCASTLPYLGFLNDGWFAALGPRLALAALMPVAVLVMLWLLARQTWQRYELFEVPQTQIGEGLEAPDFWRGRYVVSRLRTVHVSVSLAGIAALLGYGVLRHDLDTARDYAPVGWMVMALSAAVVTVGVCALCTPAVIRNGPATHWIGWALRLTLSTALVSLLVAGVYACLSRPDWTADGVLPGYDFAITALLLGQCAIVLLLVVTTTLLRRTAKRDSRTAAASVWAGSPSPVPGPALAGFMTPLLAALAVFAGVAFSAGITYRITDWLNRGAAASFAASDGLFEPPLSFEWAAFSLPFALAAVLIVVATIRLGLLPLRVRRARAITNRDFPGKRRDDPRRAQAIDAAIGEASLIDAMPRIVTVLLLPAMALVTVFAGLAIGTGIAPADLAIDGVISTETLQTVTSAGSWLIGAAVLALVAVGVQAYRTLQLRRLIGVFWDIATFWPRATHPLAPPCYAERAVPELVTRGTWLAEHGGVILSGHSQGSVLVGAAALQLPTAVRPGTALLTYGCPLRRLYARYFPAYFGLETMRQLVAVVRSPTAEVQAADTAVPATCRWRNLWRSTDPIGGPIGIGDIDQRLVDPPHWNPTPGDTVAPPIRAHCDYPADAAYPVCIAHLADAVSGNHHGR